jgi:chorismate mutase/prephenate dehydratase
LSEQELTLLRGQIDIIDGQLLDLLSQRAQVAAAVARVKGASGDNNCYRPEREARVLRKILDSNPGPLADEEVARLFREIMSACLALEQPLTVGFLGPEGTFTQVAALKHFGHSVRTVPLAAIDAVFREVEAEDCDYGVVPIENSIEGVVNHTLDTFMNSPLKICGEVEVRVHHHLLSESGSLKEITRVYAHQQALAQCRRWLDGQLLHADRIALSSNAEAARRVKGETGAAAIAGETAAEIYGLDYLARNIEDEPDNTTRFLIIGRHDTPPSGDDKTSLLLAAPNRPGALYHLLEAFDKHGVSMTRIESRPSRRGTWDYVFFVDIEGHAEQPFIAAALELLRERASLLKVLGSYPRAAL